MAGGSSTPTTAARGGRRLVIYRSAGGTVARVERGRRGPRVVVAQATYAGCGGDVGQYLPEQQMVQKWGMSVLPTKCIGYFVSHQCQQVKFSPQGGSCPCLVLWNSLALVHHRMSRSPKPQPATQTRDTDHQVYAHTRSPESSSPLARRLSP